MAKRSKVQKLSDAIKAHGVPPLTAYHMAKAVIDNSRIKDADMARARMNTSLRSTPLCAWFDYEDGPRINGYNYGARRSIQVRHGAEVIVEFACKSQ